ncbi:hypothetical protein ABZP36_033545, partial [Zizania latifolia]
MENGRSYLERLRTFSTVQGKSSIPPIVRLLMRINPCAFIVLLLLAFSGVLYIGFSTSPIVVFVFCICTLSLFFSLYLTKWVLAKDEGPPDMSEISDAIRDGVEGFFRTQYGTISKMACILALVILGIYLFQTTTPQQEASVIGSTASAYISVASFLLGALCSGMAGFVGMWVSVRANVRVSTAARTEGSIAVRAGGFSAIVVVGMAVFGVSILYSTLYVWLGVDSPGSMKVTDRKFLVSWAEATFSMRSLVQQLAQAEDSEADLLTTVVRMMPAF